MLYIYIYCINNNRINCISFYFIYLFFSKILANYSYSVNSRINKVYVCMYVCMYVCTVYHAG